MTLNVVPKDNTVDEQGVKYSDYPMCPYCGSHRVGRNHIGRTGDPGKNMFVNDWYCYKCCLTF